MSRCDQITNGEISWGACSKQIPLPLSTLSYAIVRNVCKASNPRCCWLGMTCSRATVAAAACSSLTHTLNAMKGGTSHYLSAVRRYGTEKGQAQGLSRWHLPAETVAALSSPPSTPTSLPKTHPRAPDHPRTPRTPRDSPDLAPRNPHVPPVPHAPYPASVSSPGTGA